MLALEPGCCFAAVLQWKAPTEGRAAVTGAFLAGGAAVLNVAVRVGGAVFASVDAGAFDLRTDPLAAGDTIDFIVYGNATDKSTTATPLNVTVVFTALASGEAACRRRGLQQRCVLVHRSQIPTSPTTQTVPMDSSHRAMARRTPQRPVCECTSALRAERYPA